MAPLIRDRDRERIEQDLQKGEYRELLTALKGRQSFLRQFSSWREVIAFMRAGTSRDPRKDEILRPIFEAHAEDRDPRWRTILLVIFWPAVKSIQIQKRHWDEDPDELLQNIYWVLLQVLCRVDVRKRPSRLVQKVFNDTVHKLHDEYRKIWLRADREIRPDPELLEAIADANGIDLEGIERRCARDAEIRRLRGHVAAGRLTEESFLLIVGTRVYGRSLADYARAKGLNIETAKKRRQRAESSIRRDEEKARQADNRLSPPDGVFPPLVHREKPNR